MFLFDLLSSQSTKSTMYHGGGEYGFRVIYEFFSREFKNINTIVTYNYDLYIPTPILEIFAQLDIKTIDVKSPEDVLNAINTQEIKLYYSPLGGSLSLQGIPLETKIIETYHDVRFLHLSRYIYTDLEGTFHDFIYPKGFKHKIYFEFLVKFNFINSKVSNYYFNRLKAHLYSNFKRAHIIITSSEYSRQAINFYFNYEFNSKIKVIYVPKNRFLTVDEKKRIIEEEYFLMISANRPEKNVRKVIEVLDDLYTRNLIEPITVVCGNYPSFLIKRLKNPTRFVFLNYLSVYDLENLYKYNKMFIFPSLSEGFGMPPLEVLKHKGRVLTSYITSIPEIYGKSVFYLNPFDHESIALSILSSMESAPPPLDDYIKTTNRQDNDLLKLMNILDEEYLNVVNYD